MAGRRLIGSGSRYEAEIGYSRAVVDGDWIFVSGTTGFDYAAGTIAEGAAAQCERALDTVGAALAEAGFGFVDAVRVRTILPDPADFEGCWPALRARLGAARPAATMIVAGLIDLRMRIEIELTGRRRG